MVRRPRAERVARSGARGRSSVGLQDRARGSSRPRWRWVLTELTDRPRPSAISATRHVVVVAQRQAVALAAAAAHAARPRRPRRALRLSAASSADGSSSAAGGRCRQRHEAAPVVVAGEVDDDRAEVCRRPRFVRMRACCRAESDEGLLHEVLRRRLVVDVEPGQVQQRWSLGVEQRGGSRLEVVGLRGRVPRHGTNKIGIHHLDRRSTNRSG